MDSNGNQRKRGGRLSKNASANETISPTNENEIADVSAVAISPTLEEVVSSSPSVPVASECRRSSRKKIIKFDVRDLLNKNRKTHKIQIEARIDSNAPSTSKATTAKGSEVANSAAASTVRQDMLSKQKTFLEKSAIFRRYSISQEHKTPPLPLPMPPLLGKANDSKETVLSATSSTRRLSRTQEFFSNVMIKPKQTTSLIVAQIESNTPSFTTITKRRNVNKSIETEVKSVSNLPTEVQPQVVQQRKRGRPARIKIPTPVESTTPTTTPTTAKKLTPEKAKNWKEYKACLAQQHGQTTETVLTQDTINQKSFESTLPAEEKIVEHITADDVIIVASKPNKISVDEVVEKANQQSEHVTLLDIPITVDNVEVKELELTTKFKSEANVKADQLQIKSDTTSQNQEESLNTNKPSQKLEEDTNLLGKIVQEDQRLETNLDQIDLSTEQTKEIDKLATGSKQIIHNSRHQLENKVEDVLTVDDEEKLPETQAELEKSEEFIELSPEIIAEIMEESVQSIIEIDSHSSSENNEKVLLQSTETLQESAPKETLTTTHTTLTQPSTPPPTKQTIAAYSRTSSSSESENASEHSSYSSAPSSASSSTPSSRSYKSNDKLRVSVKRLSLPKSPSTSSQTSTSEELNPNVLRKKPPMAKRSKRLQRKFFDKLDDQSSFESVEQTASISSVSMDNKFDIERSQISEHGEQLANTSAQMAQEASVIGKVSTKKSLRIRKDNISESSDDYQSRETNMDKQLSIQAPKDSQHELQEKCLRKDKEIDNITAEEHSEGKPNQTEVQPTTKEQQEQFEKLSANQSSTEIENITAEEHSEGKPNETEIQATIKGQQKRSSREDVDEQEQVSDMVEHVVLEERVSIEYNEEIVVQEDLEKAINNADSKDFSTTVAEECIVITMEEEVDTKLENIPCDAKDNTLEALNLPENIAEMHVEPSSPLESSHSAINADILDEHTTESNDKKSISEKETISSPKRKSLRQQKDKNTAEPLTTASETDTPNDSSTAKEHISASTLEDKPELKSEQNVKDKVLPKRKARKSRFKNLHDTDSIGSETDSSGTGKQTPIEEANTLMPTKIKETPENIVAIETQSDKLEQNVNPVMEEVVVEATEPEIIFKSKEKTLEDIKQSNREAIEVESVTEEYATSSNLLSSHIQNVSIETNTLLDILRTVQSNTEAALKASKCTKDTTTAALLNEETIQQDNVVQTSIEDDSASKTGSRTCESESPLTLITPTTSQSSSPKTHKQTKVTKQLNMETALESFAKDPILVKETTNESEETIHRQEKPSGSSKEDDRPSNTSSLTRCEVESPVALNDVKLSASNSQTASPLGLKNSKRSVKSNTETVLKSNKSTKDSSPTLFMESTNEGEGIIEEERKSLYTSKKDDRTLSEANSPLTLKGLEKSPSRSQTSSPLTTQKKSKRSTQLKTDAAKEAIKQDKSFNTSKLVESESKTHSPTPSKVESPLTLKSVPTSPSRSQTSSPLTHKKSKRTGQASIDPVLEANKSAEESKATLVSKSVETTEQIKETIQQAEVLNSSKTVSPKSHETELPLTLKDPETSQPSRSNTASPSSTSKKTKRSQQSNTGRSKNSTPTVVNESDDHTDQIKETIQRAEAVSTSKEDEMVTKSNSPTRCEAESPLTLKGIQISPTRSQSASPLTYLKTKCSPTRSNSSSPLTLKKVTRRYERRSRRGDESTHKTLEETFAEIAAQSSQAVLAAKEIDIAEEEEAANNKIVLNEPQTVATSLETLSETPPIAHDTTVDELESNKATDIMENLLDAITVEGVIDHTTPLECEQTNEEGNINETKELENVSEQQEINKPAKRGRKPKNRTADVSAQVTKDIKECELEHNLPVKEKDDDKVKKSILASDAPPLPGDDLETNKLSKTESKESGNKGLEQQTATAEIANDNKVCKNSNKKRNTTKEELQEADVETPESIADDSCKANDEEDMMHTSKQLTKKRDSSQTKTETKTSSKAKLTKKTKNNEEEQQSVGQKDDINPIPVSTTSPASKRGRKPKNQQETPPSSSGSKRKPKKDIAMDNNKEEDINEVHTKMAESENESKADGLDKTLDEKLAKKKRQKKLKEAFEAALADDLAKNKDATANLDSKSDTLSLYSVSSLDQNASLVASPTNIKDSITESTKITCITPVEAEEDPDPLKDIEKFIADGVNLLKKDYKLDEDSVDDVLTAPTKTTADTEIPKETTKTTDVDIKPIVNTFETPADTPINTPSVTPPPKSPTSQLESSMIDENSGVRRSHRIKLITKTPKALVGRGLVRDKERFSIKDDVETKIHYTLDDHLTGLAEVEAKNAKFLKDMEERLSNFQVIKENEYLCERVVSREAKKMICDCFLTHEEEERGELGCGEDCLNRLLMIECGPDCNVKERCTNKRFQKLLCSPCRVFRTEKKGFGIMADIEILPGEFIMEYVGEVIDTDEFEKRRIMYSQDKNRHYYFMALRSDAIIDATIKGNISRFINHSCDPNAETQKWTVNGELRIGFFSRKSIMPGEEITFNYQYQRYGREAQRCYCESANCRGWIGQEPTSDEGEQIDDEDDESEDDDEEEEEADTSNLLVHDDDEDSDASVADPEEVQKQLEMAAAQAEVELAPLKLLVEKDKKEESLPTEEKVANETNKTENEEDSKSKFKKLLSKMAEKVAAKHKQNKREQKMQRKKKSKESSADLANKLKFSEDPDIEDEVEFLKECGLKNQSDTLRLSRLMVRAKLIETRLNLLEILRKGELPCRRLFLDYHGLRLLHGWMSEDAGNMQIRLALLQTLETLPIANKTVLTDSKVMQAVRNWCGSHTTLSPNEDSSSSNSNSQDPPTPAAAVLEEGSDLQELQKLALKLVTTWEGLPEIFRIPKKERIEQMKEHEREADRQYAANAETSETTTDNDRYRRDRFGRVGGVNSFNNTSNRFVKPNNGNPLRTTSTTPENIKNLSKAQRREMFAAKVARDEAEKRLNEERREFETKCRFFGLDPKKTRPQDVPFCVNPATGQWFSIERKPITTPPSYAHVQVPVKPKSTDPKDYQLPAVCATLPLQWKYAITPQGKIYYYHIKYRVPQWEPPTAAQLQQCENEEDDDSESEYTNTTGEESTDDEDDILIGMDAIQLKAYIDKKVEARRQKRYQRLVDERAISPRREEDRIYNQIEVRKYKENKEKIRKRKEEIRRKRAEALRQSSLNMCTLGSLTETSATANVNKLQQTESDEELGALPIQDYLISSDEEDDIKAEVNSPLIDRIVEGDKIVDELDALTTKRQLKRPLPPHRDLSEPSTSAAPGLNPTIARQEYKKRKLEKKEKRKPKEQDAKYRKTKEKFRCEIAGIIVHHLKPYRKDTCTVGRIQSNEDFNHLARKLTHFVMIKELKYCESVGQTLVVTESVKSKSREFIKKYMAKYGDVYVKPTNDPEFKDIPFTL